MGAADANLAEDGTKVPVQPGQVLLGKYRVDRILGFGGMGVVVAATHLQLDEPVAIKFLLPAAMESPEAVARFSREARAAVKIKSEHVGRIIDVGSLDTGAPYIVMEYLEGKDLAQLLALRGSLSTEEAVEYLVHACDAIAHAHVLGIVHRDLKPANLFLTQRPDGSPCVKVLDFGISKIAEAGAVPTDAWITRTSATVGSPLYMPPEQMTSSRDVDQRADIWSLGAILYELLSGKPPFGAATIPQIYLQIMQGNPDPLRSVCPSVPARLQDVIERCLRKDPSERYQTVGDLACALAPFAPARTDAVVHNIVRVFQAAPPSSRSASLGSGVHSRGPRTDAPWSRTKARHRSQLAAWIGGAVAGAIALTAGAFVVGRATYRSHDSRAQAWSASLPTAMGSSAASTSPTPNEPPAEASPSIAVAYASVEPPAPVGSRAAAAAVPSGRVQAADDGHVIGYGVATGRARPVGKPSSMTTNSRRVHVPTSSSADLLRERK